MAQTPKQHKAKFNFFGSRRVFFFGLGCLCVAALLIWIGLTTLPDGRLHVTFLDVGKGDAVWIETPDGKQILIDGGPSPSALLAHLGRRMAVWDRSLDLVISTNSQDRHLAGLIAMLERYQPAQVLQSSQTAACDLSTCDHWRALLTSKQVQVVVPQAGTQIDLGHGIQLVVLDSYSQSGSNDSSTGALVLRLEYGQTSFLLASSADEDTETVLLAHQMPVHSDVLQIGDQGGMHATTKSFLSAVSPALAVISCAQDRQERYPAQDILHRLEQYAVTVVRTDERGSIEIISNGMRYEVHTDKR